MLVRQVHDVPYWTVPWRAGGNKYRSMHDIFLSYKREDRARVKPLVDALEAEGLSVWWDVHIEGGSAWRESIQKNLESARCVIVAIGAPPDAAIK